MARKNVLVSLPTNLTELDERLALVGTLSRKLSTRKVLMEAQIAEIKRLAQSDLAPLAEAIERETRSIEMYATANRSTLLVGDAKSVSLSAGRIGWRLTPLRVSFLKKGAEKALAFLEAHKMKKYLRVTTEINKEALLADRPAVDGVKYKQDDEFFIEPAAEPTKVEAIGEVLVVSK